MFYLKQNNNNNKTKRQFPDGQSMPFTLINLHTKLSLFNGPTKNPVVNITWTNPGVGYCTFVLIGYPGAHDGLLMRARVSPSRV